MTAARTFIENVIFAGLSAASNGLAFILIIYAAHVLSPDDMGVLNIALAFAAIGEPLMDFGLHQASILRIARNRDDARPVLTNIIPMKAISGAAMFVVLATAAAAVFPAAVLPIALMLVAGVIRSYLLTFRGVLQGLEHFRHDAAVMFADRGLMLVGGVAALWLGGGVAGLALSFVFTRAAALMFALALMRHHTAPLAITFDTALWRELRAAAIPLGGFLMVLTTYNYVDQLLLAHFSGTWDEGVYGSVYRIYEALTYGSGVLASVMTPRLAALWASDRAAHRHYAIRGVAGSAALGLGLSLCAWALVPWALQIFPADYAEGARSLRVLISGLGLIFATWILYIVAMSIGNSRLLVTTAILSLLANIGLNVWLIPMWHRDGAAIATVGGEAVALLMLVWGLRRVLFGPPKPAAASLV